MLQDGFAVPFRITPGCGRLARDAFLVLLDRRQRTWPKLEAGASSQSGPDCFSRRTDVCRPHRPT